MRPLPKKAVKKKTVEVPVSWLERLLQISEEAYIRPEEYKHYLYGYIQSAKSLITLSPKQQKKTKKGFTHSQK